MNIGKFIYYTYIYVYIYREKKEKIKETYRKEKETNRKKIPSTLCGALTRSPGSVLRSRVVSEIVTTVNCTSTIKREPSTNRSRSMRLFAPSPPPYRHDFLPPRKRIRETQRESSVGVHNCSTRRNNSFRGYDFLFGGDRNESHGCLVARQNRWAAYGQSSPRWTTLTGSPRNRKAIYRFSAPPKDSRYRLIGTERIIVDDMRSSSNEKSRGGDDCRNFLKNFSFFFLWKEEK